MRKNQPDRSNRLFLTGASGYVGRALVPQLLADGWKLTLLLRPDTAGQFAALLDRSGFPRGDAAPIRILEGDVRDVLFGRAPEDFADHWGGVHLAALPKLSGRSELEMTTAHVGAAAELGRIALEMGWRHVVALSTAFVPSECGCPLREEATSPRWRGANHYESTKARAEHVLSSMLGGRVDIVRPGIILPPAAASSHCLELSPLGAFVQAISISARRSGGPAIPGSPYARPGFSRMTDTVSFARHLLTSGRDEEARRTAARFWNLVPFCASSVAEIADAVSRSLSMDLQVRAAAPGSLLEAWMPYVGETRRWKSERTAAEFERARLPWEPISATEVATPLTRLLSREFAHLDAERAALARAV